AVPVAPPLPGELGDPAGDLGRGDGEADLGALQGQAAASSWSKKASTAARNEGTSGSSLMRWRSSRPCGTPWVYQPVNLRSLCSAQFDSSRSATRRKWARIRSRRAS